jgi:hypothetical protein
MNAKLRVFVAAVLVFCGFLLVFPARLVSAQVANPEIHILSDGSVVPDSVPISRSGDVYTFTGDIYTQGILVEKAGVTIDGAGHLLMGPYTGNQTLWTIGAGPNQTPTNETFSIGVDLLNRSMTDLTVKNLNIKNFSIGMYMWTAGSVVQSNSISNAIIGVLIQANGITVRDNYIADNKHGLYFGETSTGNISANVQLYGNSFVNNSKQLDGCVCIDYNLSEAVHNWDNGSRGNFWSDYNGTDSNGDGIGDTPYEIDVLNVDRFPLVENVGVQPTPNPAFEVTMWHVAGLVAVVVVAVVAATAVLARRKRQPAKPETCMPQ